MLPNPLFLNVHMYGIMIAVGIACAFGVIFLYFKKKKINEKFTDFVFYNGLFSIIVGFAFATLFSAFYHFLENPEDGFVIGQSFTFIGGLIGGAGCFLAVYCILRKRISGRLYEVISMMHIMAYHEFEKANYDDALETCNQALAVLDILKVKDNWYGKKDNLMKLINLINEKKNNS